MFYSILYSTLLFSFERYSLRHPSPYISSSSLTRQLEEEIETCYLFYLPAEVDDETPSTVSYPPVDLIQPQLVAKHGSVLVFSIASNKHGRKEARGKAREHKRRSSKV